MKKWFVENSLGLYPPLLERSLKGSGRGAARPNISYRECSVSYMVSLTPLRKLQLAPGALIVRGYQASQTRTSSINFRTGLYVEDEKYVVEHVKKTRVINFSCYDNTILYIFIESSGKTCVYYSQFNGCCALRNPAIPIYELELFESDGFYRIGESPVFSLDLKCINIKSKLQGSLHYSWTEPEPGRSEPGKAVCSMAFEGKEYKLWAPECIFCFRRYSRVEDLLFHLNHLHLNYSFEWSTGAGPIGMEERMEEEEEKFFSYRSTGSRSRRASSMGPRGRSLSLHRHEEKEFLSSSDFIEGLACMINKNIGNMMLLPGQTGLMKKWNELRLRGNSVLSDIKYFAWQEHNDPYIVEFLFVLYHKCVINPRQMTELVASLCAMSQQNEE
jgi:hypothetical protein